MLRARNPAHHQVVQHWGPEWMNPCVCPLWQPDPPSCTCHVCCINHATGQLGPNNRRLFNLIAHNATTRHQAKMAANAAINRVAMVRALGLPLQAANPITHTMKARCYVCALDPHGVPRIEFNNIGRHELAAHLNGANHARRLADGRLDRYNAIHQAANNIGTLPGELW